MEFCGDLRGEEVTLLSLGGLLTFWADWLNSNPQYIMLTLHGRFKGETGLRWHCIPIPVKTKSSLPNFKWIARAVHRRVNLQGRHKGWFFADGEGKKRKMSYYEPMLQDHLLSVQENMKDVIPTSVDVEGFSLWRSGRSGAHTEATNNQVPEHVIRTMGRWRSKELAKGANPGLPMTQSQGTNSHHSLLSSFATEGIQPHKAGNEMSRGQAPCAGDTSSGTIEMSHLCQPSSLATELCLWPRSNHMPYGKAPHLEW
eukprot:scaffold7947_cov52-Cyclotella_meneghiniana.AAC.3